jgi:GR25 family glycosyltransferase involved in LPS biosynthesis
MRDIVIFIIFIIIIIILIIDKNLCNKTESFIETDEIININNEIQNKYKFIIYTQNLGLLIAESIGHMLKKLNYEYTIVLEITLEDVKKNRKNPYEIYIILFPQTLKNFPDVNKYIIYQLEQYKQSKWITNDYKKKIDNSIFTWEYSLENYNNFEPEYKKKIYYFPLPILNIVHEDLKQNHKYDIIFVGAPNKRRNDIIRELKKKYKVLFLTKTFNNDLYDMMEQAKIILNLHYYKNAILETTRINEALFNNKIIISEEPDEYDLFNKKMYEKNIIFIDEIKDDLSNIESLFLNIDKYLNEENYYSKLSENNNFINKIFEYSFYFFYISLNKNKIINKSLNYKFKNLDIMINDKIKYIKNIVILTCNFNDKDDDESNNLNKIINKDYLDWYYFSNINNKISGWDVINNDYYDKNMYKLDNYSKKQYYKTQNLRINLLNKYLYVIWIDPLLKINNDNYINELLNIIEINQNNDLFILENNKEYIVNEEKIKELNIDDDIKIVLLKQFDDYKSTLKNNKIYNSKFLIYKNNDKMRNLFDNWWDECIKYDFKLNLSLALTYLLIKNDIKPQLISRDLINKINENELYNKFNGDIIKKLILNNNFNELENLQIDFTKINFIDGIIWLNSDVNIKRAEYMTNLLKNISIKNYRISEIDGNSSNIMDTFTNVNFDRKLTNNEIAKTLSHIKSISFLENIEGKYFLICEDNICFKNTVLIDIDIKQIIESSPKFDILLLNKNYLINIEELYSKWNKYYKPIENEYVGSTAAYIISREGINKLLKFAKYSDSYFKLDKKNNLDLSDVYIYKYLDTFVYKYNYIGTKNIELTDNQQQNEDKNNLFQLNIIIKDFHNKK